MRSDIILIIEALEQVLATPQDKVPSNYEELKREIENIKN
jgi:hypothetical protein